jgi:hypothetical protein
MRQVLKTTYKLCLLFGLASFSWPSLASDLPLDQATHRCFFEDVLVPCISLATPADSGTYKLFFKYEKSLAIWPNSSVYGLESKLKPKDPSAAKDFIAGYYNPYEEKLNEPSCEMIDVQKLVQRDEKKCSDATDAYALAMSAFLNRNIPLSFRNPEKDIERYLLSPPSGSGRFVDSNLNDILYNTIVFDEPWSSAFATHLVHVDSVFRGREIFALWVQMSSRPTECVEYSNDSNIEYCAYAKLYKKEKSVTVDYCTFDRDRASQAQGHETCNQMALEDSEGAFVRAHDYPIHTVGGGGPTSNLSCVMPGGKGKDFASGLVKGFEAYFGVNSKISIYHKDWGRILRMSAINVKSRDEKLFLYIGSTSYVYNMLRDSDEGFVGTEDVTKWKDEPSITVSLSLTISYASSDRMNDYREPDTEAQHTRLHKEVVQLFISLLKDTNEDVVCGQGSI